MFGTRIDNEITMLQRVVALLRDLVLGVTVALTCVIIYFGGDTSKLSILDWTKLIAAATLIVVGPIVGYFLIRGLLIVTFWVSRFFGEPFEYVFLQGPMPNGIYQWITTSLLRKSHRDYAKFWRWCKSRVRADAVRSPQFYSFVSKVARLNRRFEPFVVKWYPYLFAVLTLILAIKVFRHTITLYIPTRH